MKKINKKILTTITVILILIGFYKINEINYEKHIIIKQNLVEHPEDLPTKEAALNSSFGFKNLKADIYWLETVQYIGGNVIGAEYKKYLFTIIDVVTELNPYFEHPYTIGQLLLPSYNQRYESLSDEEQKKHIQEAINLGKKGMKNFCDSKKVELIRNEDDLQKIWNDEKYNNPCSEFNIPYFLAYIYYHYQKDPSEAAQYYKIASAVEGAAPGAKTMAAIMSGKGGDREKSYFMLLNIAKAIDNKDEGCMVFASVLENAGLKVFKNKTVPLSGTFISNVEKDRLKILGEFSEENESDLLSNTECRNFVNKATRELNLAYIENANEKYEAEKGKPSIDAQQLYEEGFLEYLPIDFQQYEKQGMIYYYNDEIGNYDYMMKNK